MRVVLISAAGELGGAERVLLDLATALARRGAWQPHVVAMADGPLADELGERGVPVTVEPLPFDLAQVGESGRSPVALASSVARGAVGLRRYVRRLRGTLGLLRPEIVHANGVKPSLLAAMCAPAGAVVVWHLHDYPGARRSSARAMRWLARRASLVLATSESLARDARIVLPHTPVRAVLNGIEVGRFSSEGPREDLDARAGLAPAPGGTVRIGLPGTFARWKGHDVFLRALSQLRDDGRWRGYVIGAPVYQTTGSQFLQQELESIAAAGGLAGRVGFTGFLADNAAALRALDIVVHASTAPEPFGLVLAEAMAAGRALITTAAGGSAELVRDGENALVVPAGDPVGLADAIARLIADADLRRHLGAAGRAHAAAAFTLDRFAAGVEAAYAAALSGATTGFQRAG